MDKTKNSPKKVNARRFAQDFSGPSMTDQSFAKETNVNHIISKYIATGIDPAPGAAPQNFGFATSKTYAEISFQMAEIDSAFASLPSGERARHSNDPAAWLDSIGTPEPDPPPETPPAAAEEPSDTPPEEIPLPVKEA